MKPIVYLMTYLLLIILLAEINTNPQQRESVFEIIKFTKGHIFSQMRQLKESLHPLIQSAFEKSIKEYEYRYLSDKEGFVDFLWDKFQELKFQEGLSESKLQEQYQHEIYEFLKEFLTFYNKLSSLDKKIVDDVVDREHLQIKNLINGAKDNSHLYDDNNFSDLSTIIEALPSYLVKSNSNDPNFKIKKINEDFKSFLDLMNEEYKIKEIKNQSNYIDKKNVSDSIVKNIKSKHKVWFSSFIEEYIKEAVINNEDFKEKYTINKMNEIDINKLREIENLERKKSLHLMKKPLNGPFRFKNLNSNTNTDSTKFDPKGLAKKFAPKLVDTAKSKAKDYIGKKLSSKMNTRKVMQGLNKGLGKLFSNAKVAKGISDRNKADREKQKKKEEVNLSNSCDGDKLEKELDRKLDVIKEKQESVKDDLKEVPKEILEGAGEPNKTSSMAVDLLKKFIQKLIPLLVKHIPFYFFKFCIPPGPLVFGCCPEAAFFPQQMYNVFTALEKVDKFKNEAKGYPDWLSKVGNEDFSETRYYVCAQGYLTIHESALFNMCNPKTLDYTNPLNLAGQINGDWPTCFYACIQVLL